jgi:hypothetical protein
LERISGLAQFLPRGSVATVDMLVSGMKLILGDGDRAPLYGDARVEPLAEFYREFDVVKERVADSLKTSMDGRMPDAARRAEINKKLNRLETLLSNIRGDECLRSCKRMFIFSSKFIRDTTITPNVPLQRWIPNIFHGHQETFMRQMSQLNTAVKVSLETYQDSIVRPENGDEQRQLYETLNTISLQLGKLLRYWQSHVRPNHVFVIQESINEYSKVLMWCLYSILDQAFESLGEMTELKSFLGNWILRSIDAEHDTYALYRKTPEEIKASMNDRREREKAHKIARQDREADPEIRRLMRTALKLGYSEDAILRRTGYNAEAESLRFQELQALGLAGDREDRGHQVNPEEGMAHVIDEDGDA